MLTRMLQRRKREDESWRQETTPEMRIKEVLGRQDAKELRKALFRYIEKGVESFKDELSLVEMVFALVGSAGKMLKEEGFKSFINHVEDLKKKLSPENSGIYNMDLLKAVLYIKSFQDRASAGKKETDTNFYIALSKIYQQFKDPDISFDDRRFLLSLLIFYKFYNDCNSSHGELKEISSQSVQNGQHGDDFYTNLLYLVGFLGSFNIEAIKKLIDYEAIIAVSKDNRNLGFNKMVRCIERIQVLQDTVKYITDSDIKKEEFCGYIKGIWERICLQIQQYLLSYQDNSIPPEELLTLERHLRDVNPELSIFLRMKAIDEMTDRLSTDTDIASHTRGVLEISKLYTSVRMELCAYRFLKESLKGVRNKINEDNKIYLYRILAEIGKLVLKINNPNHASLDEELKIPDNWINEICIGDLDSVFMAVSIFRCRMQNNMVEEGEYRALIDKISKVNKLAQEKSHLIDAVLALIIYAYNIKEDRN